MTNHNWRWTVTMSFAERLTALRRSMDLTQTKVAELTGIHLSQIKRYESGHTQPSLEILRKIALALHVSSDVLVFDEDERGPDTADLKLAFEAVSEFDEEDQEVAKKVIHGLIMQHQNKKLTAGLQRSPANRAAR